METVQKINQLESSIALTDLRFADWVAIASSFNQDARWGFFRWRDSVNPEVIKDLTLQEWEAIADEIGWSGQWAYKQFKEYGS
jgi:hypothetical protein